MDIDDCIRRMNWAWCGCQIRWREEETGGLSVKGGSCVGERPEVIIVVVLVEIVAR